MNIFDEKSLKPMLIQKEQEPFDDPDYIYELKLDGVRCLAYLNSGNVELRNKRNINLTRKFPELQDIAKQAKQTCILDGELYVFHDGSVDFFEIQKRTLTSDQFKHRIAAKRYPATFTAFDILYVKDHLVIDEPLIKRKKILEKTIKESERLNLSRYIENDGLSLFQLTAKQGLEGIVAKKKDSRYYPEKKTKDWIKCKNLQDDDYIITGYIPKEKGIVSLVLAQYAQQELTYMGHVTMGVSLPYLLSHSKSIKQCPFSAIPNNNEDAIWISPFLVGTVTYMEKLDHGLRQPVFKGFREDKDPHECVYQPSR